MQFGIQIRIPIPAPVVVIDHNFKSGHAAVVHVGRGPRDLAERRRLKVALAGAGIGELAVTPSHAGIVQALVGEVWADVASHAVRLAPK